MIGYVARDKSGAIYLHKEVPEYDDQFEGWFSVPECIDITNEFSEFDNMSYTDEPIKVELKLERV